MSKATDNLGSHLLGRKVVVDTRDYDMGEALAKLNAKDSGNTPTDPVLDKTIRESIEEGNPLVTTWKGLLKLWALIKELLHAVPNPPPSPAPTPPPAPQPAPTPAVTSQLWTDTDNVLDQGQTGHCVGFGWAQFGNTNPVNDNFKNADGDAIYYEAKVIDGEPRQEDGSTVRSGAKAMQNRKRIANYVFASSLDQVKEWVLTQGPVVVGTDWENNMFNPDANNFVTPTGGVAGGHCYNIVGYDTASDVFTFLNSWGTGWANKGYFYMHASDWNKLFANQGEAAGTTELPL